jgi:hypothetical protein
MKKLLIQIRDFFLCLLEDECKYSLKKLLCYVFTIVIIYLAIFTDKSYIELLTFIAVALGIRSYERLQVKKPSEKITD